MSGMYFSARAAALNASTLAILDAGSISLRAIPIAVALAYVVDQEPGAGIANGHGKDGVLLVDTSFQEEQRAKSRYVFAWAFGDGISVDEEYIPRPQAGDGMDVDEKTEVMDEAELVWAENEGEFTRHEVCLELCAV